jgi:glycosyltransferase involved in cell wall biosynthesis
MHASQNLTDHGENTDGLLAWGFLTELARRGHRVHAVTEQLDVTGDVPRNLVLYELPRRSRNPLINYCGYLLRVRSLYDRVARSEGIDVVHQMNPVVRGLSFALLGRDVPLVLGTYVGDWKFRRGDPMYRPPKLTTRIMTSLKACLDLLQQQSADAVVATTPRALARVPLAPLRRGRLRFLHHGVDTKLFSPDPRAGDLPACRFGIVFIGAVEDYNGVATLIDAFAQIATAIPQAELIFIGRGGTERWKERLESRGLANRAVFLGPLSQDDVARRLRACAVLCAPSYGEPYGQNMLEAMASGKPVIGTSTTGHRHLIDLKGGFLIEPGDDRGLAGALLAVLGEPERAGRMGSHNRRLVEKRNAWSEVAGRLERIYADAIERRRLKRSDFFVRLRARFGLR